MKNHYVPYNFVPFSLYTIYTDRQVVNVKSAAKFAQGGEVQDSRLYCSNIYRILYSIMYTVRYIQGQH